LVIEIGLIKIGKPNYNLLLTVRNSLGVSPVCFLKKIVK